MPIHIPGYCNFEKIAEGGIGAVFLAETEADPRTKVAIKRLKNEIAVCEKDIRRFCREGRVGKNLHHPHLLPVHDFCRVDGVYYLIMEYVEGKTFGEMIAGPRKKTGTPSATTKRFHPADLVAQIRVVSQVASALAHAHEQGVIHRDIKPSNILVRDRDQHAFLADFGLARNLGDDTITSMGMVVGTPLYMAPEQILGDLDRVDYRSDIYSLGMTAFEGVVGGPPFSGSNFEEIRESVLFGELPRIRPEVAREFPGLEEVLFRCLEKKRRHRYQAAEDLSSDLLRIADGKYPTHASRWVLHRRSLRRVFRNRTRIIALLLVLVTVIGFVVGRAIYLEGVDREIEVLLIKGSGALDSGEFDEALALLDSAIELEPDRSDGYVYRGAAFYEFGLYPEAKAEFKKAMDRGSPGVLTDLRTDLDSLCFSLFERLSSRPVIALEVLDTLVNRDKPLDRACLPLYHVLTTSGLEERARDTLELYRDHFILGVNPKSKLVDALLLEHDGKAISATTGESSSREDHKKYREAQRVLEDLLDTQDESVVRCLQLRWHLGRVLCRLDDYESAVRHLDRVVVDFPDHIESWVQRAHAYCALGDLQSAEDSATAALSLNRLWKQPLYLPQIYLVLGSVASQRERFSRAKEEVQKAMRLPSATEEDLRDARGLLRSINAQEFYVEGTRLQDQGEELLANEAFMRCLEVDGEHALALNQLGWNRWAEKQLESANRFFVRADAAYEAEGWNESSLRQGITTGLYATARILGKDELAALHAPRLQEVPPEDPAHLLGWVEGLILAKNLTMADLAQAEALVQEMNLKERLLDATLQEFLAGLLIKARKKKSILAGQGE